MKQTKKQEVMIKAIAAFNKLQGSERVKFVRSKFRGPRDTFEDFVISVDGVEHNFFPTGRNTIKDYVYLLGIHHA